MFVLHSEVTELDVGRVVGHDYGYFVGWVGSKKMDPRHSRNLWGYEGYRYPHILDWGTGTVPNFSGHWWRICCYLLSTEAICRLNYTKTIYGRYSIRPAPRKRSSWRSPHLQLPLLISMFSSRIGTPLFRRKLRPWPTGNSLCSRRRQSRE